jgi:hypothetical protein
MSSSEVLRPSTQEPEVEEALRKFSFRLLRIEQGVEEILETANRFPGEPALELACAYLWLYAQTPEGQTRAGEYLQRAEAGAGGLSARETEWLRALRIWHERDFETAATAFEAITTEWPQDLLAVKAAEFLYYILGQQASGPRFLAHLNRLADYHAENPDFLAMQAFAHELCGHTGEARERAEHALEIEPCVPWAQHALEHVLLWEGSPEEGVDRLESWLSSWNRAGRVIHCHNAWHVAIMHLDRLNAERAFAVFDTHVWGLSPGMVVEQLDAIAFLWRAEMAGQEVSADRYRDIAPHVRPLAETLFMPFVTAHYAYAFARAGDTDAVDNLLACVDARAAASDAEARRVWAPVGRDIIHGTVALARGHAAEAAARFDPVMPRMTIIGGSDAQDDLFRFAHLDSLKQSGRQADARSLLSRRLEQKRPSPLEEKLLSEIA